MIIEIPLNDYQKKVLSTYVDHCHNNKIRLSPMRCDVLKQIILHAPVKAYSIIHEFDKLSGQATSPPLVYRALNFLEAKNLIHKLDRIHSYIPCQHTFFTDHPCVLFHCHACHQTIEVCGEQYFNFIKKSETENGFQTIQGSTELYGTCTKCTKNSSKDAHQENPSFPQPRPSAPLLPPSSSPENTSLKASSFKLPRRTLLQKSL